VSRCRQRGEKGRHIGGNSHPPSPRTAMVCLRRQKEVTTKSREGSNINFNWPGEMPNLCRATEISSYFIICTWLVFNCPSGCFEMQPQLTCYSYLFCRQLLVLSLRRSVTAYCTATDGKMPKQFKASTRELFQILLRDMPEGPQENQNKLQSQYTTSLPRFEPSKQVVNYSWY
jgi:hypothetical protein